MDDDHIEPAIFNFASLLRRAAVTAPELEADIQEAMRRCGVEELIELSREMPEVTAEEVVAFADVEMNGRPFSDDIEHEEPFPVPVVRPPRQPAAKKTRARRS